MQITFTNNSLLTDDVLSKAYQEKLKASEGMTSAQGAAKESSGVEQAAVEGDVVAISEEARQKQEQEASGFAMQTGASGASEAGGEETESGDLKATLRQQIREVQKQLSEARERLSMAKGQQNNSSEQKKSEDADRGESREAAGMDGEAARAAAAAGLEDGGEVEKIMAEISQLNNTLTTLNQQLMQEERKNSGQSGAMGSAGISTGGTGRGGAGERLAVRA